VEPAKAVIRTGRHPVVLKQIRVVIICQPGKDVYMKLPVNHSKSLLSCIGKVVKRVVAKLLAQEAERRRILGDGQNGSSNGFLSIDVVAIMVDRAHTVCREGRMPGIRMMNIKATFSNLGRWRLIHTTRGKRMDGDYK
jgi:hypothetical protein